MQTSIRALGPPRNRGVACYVRHVPDTKRSKFNGLCSVLKHARDAEMVDIAQDCGGSFVNAPHVMRILIAHDTLR